MKLSIVSTLYYSAGYIEEFCQRITAVATRVFGDDFEIILVNDGSPDSSLGIAIAQTDKDSRVKVVDLSRNFGHHKAIMTGLGFSTGDYIFLIDIDLEEEPEWLEIFFRELLNKKCDVIYGVQVRRKGGLFERFSGEVFYWLIKKISGLNFRENIVTARLMTNEYVKSLILHKEREIFLAGLWHITGYDQQPYNVYKHSTSETTYNFKRKLSIFVNAITSFSNTPLMAIFYVGSFISTLAFLFVSYLIINWMFLSRPVSGWTSLIASMWLIGGMIICFIGVIGIYLSKIFIETKQRPYSIIKSVYEKK